MDAPCTQSKRKLQYFDQVFRYSLNYRREISCPMDSVLLFMEIRFLSRPGKAWANGLKLYMHGRRRTRMNRIGLVTVRVGISALLKVSLPEEFGFWVGKLLPGIEPVCMVTADLSPTSGALKEVMTDSEDARSHWKVEHSIAIQFGGIELQAFLEWVDAVS